MAQVVGSTKIFPLGAIVEGVVLRQASYGIWVDLYEGQVEGLVEFIQMQDEPVYPIEFPVNGTKLKLVVLGYGEIDKTLRLSMKPSMLEKAVK
ncbi:hypothetical protein [Hymenobacter sp. BT730]|uniref:hypothetical protein n=1 Tax=Hymenobacter sp. BT730 TaxID=3063332 RepID=UPI0026DF67C7|nr:hypothetical protein [Hymenobacter sp. BT730]